MAQLIEFNATYDEFVRKVTDDARLFVVLFWASSQQCDQMYEVMVDLAKNSALSNVTFVKVKAEELEELCDKYQVEAVPTILFFKARAVIDRLIGVDASALAQKVVTYAASKDSTTNDTHDVEDIKVHLKGLIARAPVMLFMKGNAQQPRCKFSREIVNILASQGAVYDTFDILTDEAVRQGLKELTQWPTYPQLYINGEFVGGVDIVKELAASGELQALLPSVSNVSMDDQLKALVRRDKVMLFMKGSPQAPRCGFSQTIVNILSQTGVKYGSFDILENEAVRQALKQYSNWPTYPQLYVNGELIGGLDIVRDLQESGELDDVLKADNV